MLQHLELDHTILRLAACESRASDALEHIPVFMEITGGLALRPKCRLKTAHLSNHAVCQNKGDSLSLPLLGLGNNPDVLH